jgi:hypothetical protein
MRTAWRQQLLACVVAALLITPGGSAQTTEGIKLTSGDMTFMNGNSTMRVTISDTGNHRGQATAHIKIFDSSNHLITESDDLPLGPGRPARLDLSLSHFDRPFQAHVVITITSVTGAAPVATVEDVDVDNLRAIPKGVCSGPNDSRYGPVTSCGGCPGFTITSFAVPTLQPGN